MKRLFITTMMATVLFAGAATAIAGETASKQGQQKPQAVPTAEAFVGYVLTDGLEFPWEMLWGPDDMLWVTERQGLRITRVNPETGEKKVAGRIPNAYPGPQHEGVLGMAFAPGFLKSGGKNELYVYYTMKNGDDRWARLVKFPYDAKAETLGKEEVILDKLPAGDDHNAGRVRFGPDGKIYLTIGEQGHNQGANYCLPIFAQHIPTIQDVERKNWDAYRGKSLRINPDGSVPSDNPTIQGVKSHVFTYGHRNPQGLVFVGDKLYSCEQGPSTDDEINLLEAGGNYGWPHVAGFRDGQAYVYANYSAAANCKDLKFDANIIPPGVPIQNELEWYVNDFRPPVMTLHTVRDGYDFRPDSRCGADHAYLCWPTVAPSSIIQYPTDGAIPGWRGSLLVTTLKTGALFKLRMSGDGQQLQGDYDKVFRSRNRLRVAAVDPAGRKIFIATDNSGGAVDDTGKPVDNVRNSGTILVYEYQTDGSYGFDAKAAGNDGR